MAYKVSFGNYQHSGSLQATVDITGSTTVSGAVGNFGTLTVASFNPANISSTNITASSNMSASTANFGTLTVDTFSPSTISTATLTVTGVTTLSGNVFLGDAPADIVTVNGQITGSLFAINGGAINDTPIGGTTQRGGRFTTLSASSTLDVVGNANVTSISASTGVSSSVGQFGTLTVATFNPGNINATNVTASSNMSASTANFGTATIGNGLTVNTGGITISAGGMNVTGGVQLLNGLVVNGNLTVNGPTIAFGDAAADVITVNGQITGSLFAINGGAINGTTIGATTQSSAKFTTVSSSGDVIVGGNLTVQGTTTTVNSTTLEITDKNIVIASGSTTSLLANGSGLTLGSTGYQFNFQSSSAGTSTDFWQVSGSTGLTDFKAKTVFATVDGNVTQQTTNLGDADGTLSLGINYSQADFTGPHTWTLPASPSVGQSVKVKAPHNCNITNTLTVSAGAKAIDFTGNTTVVLASPDAAMELVYVDSANNLWKIF
jgi:hypothetical protein